MTLRVAVDAMGGDHAPGAIVGGAVRALRREHDVHLVVVGDEPRIRTELARHDLGDAADRLTIEHASQVIAMDDSPIEAIRAKTDSSLVRMVALAAEGKVDAVLSSGHTGALVAACQLMLRPLACVSRPGIAVTIPSRQGPCILCDVGANISARARHLYEYSVMASLYAERVIGVSNPRVALVSVGAESGKGTDLVKQARTLIEQDPQINFVGNAEGSDLFAGRCDVAICDGFVGNVMLKFGEALAEGLFRTITKEFDGEGPDFRERLRGGLDRVYRHHDYSRYGGAPLLGVNGVCIICHGRSDELAVENAIGVAAHCVKNGFNDAITRRLGSTGGASATRSPARCDPEHEGVGRP